MRIQSWALFVTFGLSGLLVVPTTLMVQGTATPQASQPSSELTQAFAMADANAVKQLSDGKVRPLFA